MRMGERDNESNMRKHRLTAIQFVVLGFCWVIGGQKAIAQPTAGLQDSLSGWLHVIWADSSSGAVEDFPPRYVLIDDQEQWTEIEMDEARVRSLGGLLAFNRKRVKVSGRWKQPLPREQEKALMPRPHFRGDDIEARPLNGAPAAAPAAAPQAVTGSQRWVTILCRFANATSVTPQPKSYFDALLGGVPPGLDHYWREVSYDNINIIGSVVVGWYNLPQPRSYYVYDQNGDGLADLNFKRAMDDCTAVADPDVFFPNFSGINLMFNQNLDCCAWGGSVTLSRDGQLRVYRMTWEPPWGYANQDVIGHEMGHGFGLPHSSGPYSATYDSQWDVMSAGGRCSPADATYGCVGVHTISYHKDFLGWIPPARKFVPAPGSSQTIVLEPLGQPLSSPNYLMAQIPLGGSTTQFYTVEVRRFAGYDNQVPSEAIVIHKVNTTQSDRLARVVDIDNNGNPNDASARWTAGETFTDAANSISVAVNAVTPSGFSVTVGYIGAGTAALVSAVAPNSRSVQVGNMATAYALMLNYGTATALGCSLSPVSNLPATFFFQALDCATNASIADPNTPVNIPAGGAGCFIFALTPSSPIVPTNMSFNFDCTNTNPAPLTPGVNTFLFSASSTPPPDLLATAATTTGGGIVDIPGPNGTNFIALATVNVGSPGQITAEANTGGVNLPVTLTICQTDPNTGACINPSTPGPSATLTIDEGAVVTFTVIVQGLGTVPFDPAVNRVFISFHEGSINGPIRGLTSVAVRTQ